jgi:hypothetical protein
VQADIARACSCFTAGDQLRTDIAGVATEVALLKEVIGGMAARVDRSEADIARVAAEVAAFGRLRADIAALKELVLQLCPGLLDSLIV